MILILCLPGMPFALLMDFMLRLFDSGDNGDPFFFWFSSGIFGIIATCLTISTMIASWGDFFKTATIGLSFLCLLLMGIIIWRF